MTREPEDLLRFLSSWTFLAEWEWSADGVRSETFGTLVGPKVFFRGPVSTEREALGAIFIQWRR